MQSDLKVDLERGNTRGKARGNLSLRLLGPLVVRRDSEPVALPSSRKARGLLAYLAMASAPVSRTRLCDLLWDDPNDPRAELRWCLSKLRGALDDDDGQSRIATHGETISLDLETGAIDAVQVLNTLQGDLTSVPFDSLRAAEAAFAGSFADGLGVEASPEFSHWLQAQRRRFHAAHVKLIKALLARCSVGSMDTFAYLERWLELTPFEVRAHQLLLDALAAGGRLPEAELHLATTLRAFAAEGLNGQPIREHWREHWREHRRTRERTTAPIVAMLEARPHADSKPRRASVCVMPFTSTTGSESRRSGYADGLTDDIITRLAKLRVLFVIARGSVYALAEKQIDAKEAARLLAVDYVVSGSLKLDRERLTVRVELCDVRTGGIVWAEDFHCKATEVLQAIEDIGNRIVACVADEIEGEERNRAVLKSPDNLDSWEAYHRGLWHMYRFNGADNARAMHFFRLAIRQDPTFARAHAGLSFTHFQNAFLLHPENRAREIDLAYETAGQSLLADDRDPAAHWAMGRALWLHRRDDESLAELRQCVQLSPNFALGHYTLGFVQCQSGDPRAAISATDTSCHLSPFDPLTFAMYATRALAHTRLGEYEAAAGWALKGALRPNAHAHVLAIAANCLGMAGRRDEAQRCIEAIRRQAPNYAFDDFANAFHLPAETLALLRRNAPLLGL